MKRANFGNWPISFNFANNSTIDHHIKRKTFKGLIVTDAMNMGGISSLPDAEVKVIEAGCDIVLMPLDVEKSHAKLLAKYEKDDAFKKKVDAAVKRIIRMKLCIAKA